MDMTELRREYAFDGLKESDLDDNPFSQFKTWFKNAIDAKIELADVMTLATASKVGVPSARIVVLRGIDERGFVFYTDYRSAKSCDLLENPKAALVFYWRELGRQIRIVGGVQKVSLDESVHYFQTRPIESRLAALTSTQGSVIPDRKILESRYEEIKNKFEGSDIPYPENWGGYRVSPDEFEFWQGRELRLHDRIRYQSDGSGGWLVERLAP